VLKLWEKTFDHFIHLFDERPNEKIKKAEIEMELPGFGFSWLRLRQNEADLASCPETSGQSE